MSAQAIVAVLSIAGMALVHVHHRWALRRIRERQF